MPSDTARASRQHHGAPRADAKNARNCCVDDCQDCRKHLRRRHFRNSRQQRIARAPLPRDSPGRLNERRADSESQFLATKKFLRFLRWRPIASRQDRFFERIAGADSRHGFGRATRRCETRRRSRRYDTTGPYAASRVSQMPSLLLSRSLTDCGLALPPDDFIT
jgi:hypothetical protein